MTENKIPRIGEVVTRNGHEDWLIQKRMGDEQFVLYWAGSRMRWLPGDEWREGDERKKWVAPSIHSVSTGEPENLLLTKKESEIG